MLYYPGNDATQLKRGQAFLSRLRGSADWGLAVFAYRGYDSSDGVPMIGDLAADAPEIVLQLCQAEKLTPAQVNLVGFSIGSYMAIRAVGALTRQNHAPASLSLMAGVNDIVMFRRSIWERLDPGDDLLAQPFLSDIKAPRTGRARRCRRNAGGPSAGQGDRRDARRPRPLRRAPRRWAQRAHRDRGSHRGRSLVHRRTRQLSARTTHQASVVTFCKIEIGFQSNPRCSYSRARGGGICGRLHEKSARASTPRRTLTAPR